jgi:hypothetical protein
VGIWLPRHREGKWSVPVEVANGAETEDPRVNCLNPVLFQMPKGPRLARAFQAQHELAGSPGSSSGRFIGPVNDGHQIQAIQPGILFHPNNRLQALGRTQQGRLFEIWSEDGGLSWGQMSLMDLPNNNSGTDALTLRDGRHVLVYNHTGNREGKSDGERSPLNVALSQDGKAWEAALVLESEPKREFSYPAVIQTRDGLVHITYTYRRQNIRHVVLDPSKLTLKPIVKGVWPQ